MAHFMDYLQLTPTLVNQCFNTVTREGRDQIFFRDVTEVIGFLEEARHRKKEKLGVICEFEDLKLSCFEVQFLRSNFEQLKESSTFKMFCKKVASLKESARVDSSKQIKTERVLKSFGPETVEKLFQLFEESPNELRNSLFKSRSLSRGSPRKSGSVSNLGFREKKGKF